MLESDNEIEFWKFHFGSLSTEPLSAGMVVHHGTMGAIGFVEIVQPPYAFFMTGTDTFAISPRVLAKLGLQIEPLCEHAGVAPSNAWVTSDFFRIWAAADKELGD